MRLMMASGWPMPGPMPVAVAHGVAAAAVAVGPAMLEPFTKVCCWPPVLLVATRVVVSAVGVKAGEKVAHPLEQF